MNYTCYYCNNKNKKFLIYCKKCKKILCKKCSSFSFYNNKCLIKCHK